MSELQTALRDPSRVLLRTFGVGRNKLWDALRSIPLPEGALLNVFDLFPEVIVEMVASVGGDRTAELDQLDILEKEVRARFPLNVYGTGADRLPLVTSQMAWRAGVKIATAESCTGGMVGALLTDMPGSSAYYVGGAITYSNEEKVRQLGVSSNTLLAHGAVSWETVVEMASGIRRATGADYGVAISGIAGPGGGSPQKPVGTVWIAVGTDAHTDTFKLYWPRPRDEVRTMSAWWALFMLREALKRPSR